MPPSVRRWLLLLLCAALGGCTSLFLQPDRKPYFAGQALGTAVEDIWIATPQGPRLHALLLPAQSAPRATVLFLHGNAENVSSHVRAVTWLPAQGYSVLALDYRGYGRSEGFASIDTAHADAELALRWLLARDRGPVIVYGQSLGGAIALNLVARTDADARARLRAVIADSAFASYRGIAREKLDQSWLTWPLQWPLSLLISNAWSPIDVIGRISPIPLLLIHGERDVVVPPQHAQQLYAQAGEPKTLWLIPGGQHIDAMRRDELRARLLDFLNRVAASEPPPITSMPRAP